MSVHALHLLQEQLTEQEKQAALLLSRAQQKMAEHQMQLERLMEYRQTYLDQAMASAQAGIRAQGFHHYQQFLGRLDEAAAQQRELLVKLGKEVAVRRQNWQSLQARRKAIELLLEKKAAAEAQKLERQEQKHLDQFALYAYLRQKQPYE